MLRHSIWLLMLAFVVGCGGDATTTEETTTEETTEATDDGASTGTPAVNLASYTLKVPGMT